MATIRTEGISREIKSTTDKTNIVISKSSHSKNPVAIILSHSHFKHLKISPLKIIAIEDTMSSQPLTITPTPIIIRDKGQTTIINPTPMNSIETPITKIK